MTSGGGKPGLNRTRGNATRPQHNDRGNAGKERNIIKTEDTKERAANFKNKRKQEVSRRNISTRALEIVSEGTRTNPECENTAVVAEEAGEATVYRIFRQRQMYGKNPLAEADQWIRQVKEHCTGTTGELKLDFTHFKRHKRGNLQYDGTEWRGVSVHRSWRSIVKNPPTPTTSGYAQR